MRTNDIVSILKNRGFDEGEIEKNSPICMSVSLINNVCSLYLDDSGDIRTLDELVAALDENADDDLFLFTIRVPREKIMSFIDYLEDNKLELHQNG